MTASKEDVNGWINAAKESNKRYIISVCDTFEWDDYPIFCDDRDNLVKRIPEFHNTNLQKINEIIEIVPDKEPVRNLTPEDFGTFVTTFIPKE